MSWFITLLIIAGLVSFVLYNMDLVNKMSAEIRYIRTRIDEERERDKDTKVTATKT